MEEDRRAIKTHVEWSGSWRRRRRTPTLMLMPPGAGKRRKNALQSCPPILLSEINLGKLTYNPASIPLSSPSGFTNPHSHSTGPDHLKKAPPSSSLDPETRHRAPTIVPDPTVTSPSRSLPPDPSQNPSSHASPLPQRCLLVSSSA